MKKILLPVLLCLALFACKEDDTSEPITSPPTNNTSCSDLKICFNLNDTAYTNSVLMYKLDDTTFFAKYEKDGQQLSIDWFTENPSTGVFPASDLRKKGMSRIYWFPGQSSVQWMSDSGQVEITKHENNTVSATFSGRLQELVSGNPSGRTLMVKNGVFTNARYF